jgi:MFS family permease
MLPVTVLFFQEHGLNAEQIFTLTSTYAVSIVIFEVPSGYLADLWGRKSMIVLGFILSLIGNLFFLMDGLLPFIFAEIFLGIGASFISGCDSAIFYDSLKSLGREDRFKKLIGRYRSYGNFSEGLAGIFGGILASYAVVYTVYGRVFILLLGVIFSLLLVEPEREVVESREGRLKLLLRVVKYALFSNKRVMWLIYLSGTLGAVTLNMAWFSQFFFKSVDLDPIYYGVIWAAMQFASGIYAIVGTHYVDLVGKRNGMISLILFVFLGFIGLSFSTNIFVGIFFILITYFIRGVNLPVLDFYLHEEIGSDIRATVISLKSLVVRLIFTILAPFYGFLVDNYSLQRGLQAAGVVYSCLGLISLLSILKVMDWRGRD